MSEHRSEGYSSQVESQEGTMSALKKGEVGKTSTIMFPSLVPRPLSGRGLETRPCNAVFCEL